MTTKMFLFGSRGDLQVSRDGKPKGFPYIFISIALLICVNLYADDRFPISGKISGTNVNIRARADTEHEVVCQADQNEAVTVVDEKDDWYKIRLPQKATVWIFRSFVKDGVVTGDKLNVHCGPGYNFSDVCRLRKGERVKVKKTLGDWVGIVPPHEAAGYVSKKYIIFAVPSGDFPDTVNGIHEKKKE